MDMEKLMPQIKKTLQYNGILVLYYMMPNFVSFVCALSIIVLVFFDSPYQQFLAMVECAQTEEKDCGLLYINKWFKKYTELPLMMRNSKSEYRNFVDRATESG
jgi:hypothetical protein